MELSIERGILGQCLRFDVAIRLNVRLIMQHLSRREYTESKVLHTEKWELSIDNLNFRTISVTTWAIILLTGMYLGVLKSCITFNVLCMTSWAI